MQRHCRSSYEWIAWIIDCKGSDGGGSRFGCTLKSPTSFQPAAKTKWSSSHLPNYHPFTCLLVARMHTYSPSNLHLNTILVHICVWVYNFCFITRRESTFIVQQKEQFYSIAMHLSPTFSLLLSCKQYISSTSNALFTYIKPLPARARDALHLCAFVTELKRRGERKEIYFHHGR